MATDAIVHEFSNAVAIPPTAVPFPTEWTLANLQEHLGGIPLDRIRAWPPPGTATKDDVEAIHAHTKRACELIDGVLVEKTVGFYESLIAARLIALLADYLKAHPIGVVAGEAGFVELLPTQVRAAERMRGLLGPASEGPCRRGDPGDRAGLRCRGAVQGQPAGGNATEAARLFHRRRAARLVHRSAAADRSRLHGRGAIR